MTNEIKTNLNTISINFASAQRIESLQISELPIETIDYLLQGGTRKFNDSINSKVADLRKSGESFDINSLIDDLIEKIKTGDLAESRKADPDKAFKDFVLSQLKLAGIKSETLKAVKGGTVKVILQTVKPDLTDEKTDKLIANFKKKYDAMQKLFADSLIDIDE